MNITDIDTIKYDFTIDKEFANYLPSLTDTEYHKLKKSIEREGLHDPLIVWKEKGILVDGHHRLLACQELKIKPDIEYKSFMFRGQVKAWIIENNWGRRNLTPEQKKYFLGEMYINNKNTHGGDRKSSGKGCHLKTAEMIAEDFKVSEKTVRNGQDYTKAINSITENVDKSFRSKVINRESNISQQDIVNIKENYEPEKQKEIINKLENEEYKNLSSYEIEMKKQENKKDEKISIAKTDYTPKIYNIDYNTFLSKIDNCSCDLLITDPPYMTDVDNINDFANSWVNKALEKIKDSGQAYICTGAYPEEMEVYLNILNNHSRFNLANILVWTYRNTLGPKVKNKYHLNWQAIFYLRGKNAAPINSDSMKEKFAVQDINAPDGRQGNRYHKWQKPDKLAKRLIRHSTNKEDKVIDVFAGTGTFLVAAAKLSRKAIGCDIDKEVIEIAAERGCEIA